ncbi:MULTISPECIES: hypothetical protein [Prochlorococcus]|uniref:Putative BdrC3 n=1 Tax=Prochlorococcus marinus str. MIT 9116 TaxID=167544 RepID=A0A0A1ZQ02_PROMR|nr:hypothetical protein [Prochlorococcus marinus]KGF89656.1 putative BdrC3 [Prochlorococcus marinus str. MIT 9107]KGF90334.1 putative BdrC3 [Prochlorococcus marinus str. MIT 9116]KGF92814.1 putative BdrC3 [Prochlorococcus marinus str. MIT 9123]
MPTKKKRVGFIPREDVMKLIDKLSLENNLSNSKIISILVEEALSRRGIFNNKTGKTTKSYNEINNNSKTLSKDSGNCKVNEKFTMNTNLGSNIEACNSNIFKKNNKEGFDFETYKKFLSFLKFQEMVDEYHD